MLGEQPGKIAASRFEVAWWLRSPHLQTLWPTLARRSPGPPLRRERFELSDGDFVDLDWTLGSSGPIIVLLHGLEGSSASPYIRGMLQTIERRGWRGVLMHFRGCSGEPNRLPRSYHSGDTADFQSLVSALRLREASVPLAAVGFSLGGNVLLKSLGEQGDASLIDTAVAVSVPMRLGECADRLEWGFSRLYQWRLLRDMRAKQRRKFRDCSAPIDLSGLSTWTTFRHFDHHVTAPLHGFAGVVDYYAKSSSRQFLPGIRTPTLILHARDDPFMTPAVLPEERELSDTTRLEISERGGHVGFVGGKLPARPVYWLEERVPEFLSGFF